MSANMVNHIQNINHTNNIEYFFQTDIDYLHSENIEISGT